MIDRTPYFALLVVSVLTTCTAPHRTGAIPPSSNAFYSSVLANAISSSQDELNIFFGNLHGHSRLSDGNSSISPTEAYRIAREEGELDFLSLSEHNPYCLKIQPR